MSPPPTTNVASRKSGKMEIRRSFQHSGTFTVVDLLPCWSVLTCPQNSATWAGAPEDAPPAHLHLTCYCGNHALLTTLSPCFLSARTRITKPPQDQSVIKGTQASMVCGVAHDPRVTVRYSPCCGPREAKGRNGF